MNVARPEKIDTTGFTGMRYLETESRMAVARGCGEKEMGSYCLVGIVLV